MQNAESTASSTRNPTHIFTTKYEHKLSLLTDFVLQTSVLKKKMSAFFDSNFNVSSYSWFRFGHLS